MSRASQQQTIVVPIANPASVRPLLAIAAALASEGETLVPVTVVRPNASRDERDLAHRGLDLAGEAGAASGASVRGRVVEADDPAVGVLGAVAEEAAALVVMGWRGQSSTTNVFGRMLDTIVGRSAAPLAVVRMGAVPFRRVLLPISADHLLPGGDRGLGLATRLAQCLDAATPEPVTVLRTGAREMQLPAALGRFGDRVHHDPRRTDQAVAAFARPEDVIVAAVAPTVSGLRAATTHLAWAAPDATLVVAIDVGPTREEGLAEAVHAAGEPAPATAPQGQRPVRVIVTARLLDDDVRPDDLAWVLQAAGDTDQVMAWWPAGDPHPHVRATVTVMAPTVNAAISAVMVAVHDAPVFRGAEISYDLDRSRGGR
ncbi:universal stress protein [Egicoccus sp. AB-alg6-2]|uniref:universal stress protein n=1 Tax=Egicoccus sp. AB-alg6-2 TaxID=3242692 RepID=UPI00359E698A